MELNINTIINGMDFKDKLKYKNKAELELYDFSVYQDLLEQVNSVSPIEGFRIGVNLKVSPIEGFRIGVNLNGGEPNTISNITIISFNKPLDEVARDKIIEIMWEDLDDVIIGYHFSKTSNLLYIEFNY